jgi:SHS2 domain-containing protein
MNKIEPNQVAGYRECQHTADWELEVWAPDLPGLLEQAARGMYWLAGLHLKANPRIEHALEFTFTDAENLIVDFLSELLFLVEGQGIAFDGFSLQVAQDMLLAELSGAPVDSISREIKAVTYHRLAVRRSGVGLQVNIVFDV